ncbi:hypothetical protein V8E36_003974 [Tilletia maclaganii]
MYNVVGLRAEGEASGETLIGTVGLSNKLYFKLDSYAVHAVGAKARRDAEASPTHTRPVCSPQLPANVRKEANPTQLTQQEMDELKKDAELRRLEERATASQRSLDDALDAAGVPRISLKVILENKNETAEMRILAELLKSRHEGVTKRRSWLRRDVRRAKTQRIDANRRKKASPHVASWRQKSGRTV